MSDDLVTSLRALAAAQHSDLTVAADAADRIEQLTRQRNDARAEVERLREDNEKLRELLRSIRIDGPDCEGLVWVSFVSHGMAAARAHVVVGEENRMASRVALRFEELRRKALEVKP